jgi:uncharacterized membrane protein YsdA (DUF1294 family)
LYRYLGVTPVFVFLASINLVTYLVYRYDKLASGRQNALRVPNFVLAGLAVCGGSIGALIGMYARTAWHKTGHKYRLPRAVVWLSLFALVVLLAFYLIGPDHGLP